VDLSGVIFVALALAWAGYLIPKTLKQHDEMARSRSVDRFSSSLRVLGGRSAAKDEPASPVAERRAPEPVAEAGSRPAARPVTRAAARRAAARRRRVLLLLAAVTAVVGGLAAAGLAASWSPAVPGAMVLLFLVVARLTVRRERAVRRGDDTVTVTVAQSSADADDSEDTVEVSREDLAAAVAMPVTDEGSLWDPLPVTLPTYVNKARARRTVRTIELTGMASSGHDAEDSALVAQAEQDAEVAEAVTETERKVAGA
jgi:hypothetical protein